MSSPSPLSQAQLDELATFVTAGNRIGYWQTLADWGFTYANLALGVVLNDSLNGEIANSFAAEGASDASVTMTANDWAEVGQEIMAADLAARVNLHTSSPNTADLSVSQIRDYHTAVFGNFNLPPETWTAYAPTIVVGPDEEDELWADMLATEESFLNAFATDGELYARMALVAANLTNPYHALAAAWIANLTVALAGDTEVGPYEISADNGGKVVGGSSESDGALTGGSKDDVVVGYGGDDKLLGRVARMSSTVVLATTRSLVVPATILCMGAIAPAT